MLLVLLVLQLAQHHSNGGYAVVFIWMIQHCTVHMHKSCAVFREYINYRAGSWVHGHLGRLRFGMRIYRKNEMHTTRLGRVCVKLQIFCFTQQAFFGICTVGHWFTTTLWHIRSPTSASGSQVHLVYVWTLRITDLLWSFRDGPSMCFC